MKKIFILLLSFLIIILSACSAPGNDFTKETEPTTDAVTAEETQEDEKAMTYIKVTVNGKAFDAKVYNNSPCAQQLLSKFPLTVTMNELNGNEKYYKFSESFPTNPENVESINSGDIMLYQSDYLVLFYEAHNTSYTYTRIGYITDTIGLKEAVGTGNPTVTFEIS